MEVLAVEMENGGRYDCSDSVWWVVVATGYFGAIGVPVVLVHAVLMVSTLC